MYQIRKKIIKCYNSPKIISCYVGALKIPSLDLAVNYEIPQGILYFQVQLSIDNLLVNFEHSP